MKMRTVKQAYHNAGIELSEEEEKAILGYDLYYARVGFPGFASALLHYLAAVQSRALIDRLNRELWTGEEVNRA